MIEYLTNRSTLFSFISDIIILTGIFFMDWSASRAMAFICFDIEVMIFFFIIFMKMKNEIKNYFSMLFGFFILSSLMFAYFLMLVSLKSSVENTDSTIELKDITILLNPYFDIALFILISGMSHFQIVRELVKVQNQAASLLFGIKAVIYRMSMVPVILIIGGLISIVFHSNIYTTPFVIFIVMKEILEYWKFKAFLDLQVKYEE